MRVLIVTPIFFPEMGALANRLSPFVRQLTRAGHEVFVATGMPNYPTGSVFSGYRGRRFMTEHIDGCTVIRTSYFTTPRNKSKWRQLLSYLSFIPAAIRSGLKAGAVDVVFVTSPPIFPVIAGLFLSKVRHAKFVFDVRDLWPDEIVACGAAASKSISIRFVSLLERLAYRKADAVCCTTRAFMEAVASRGAKRDKILLVPNGADLSVFRPTPSDSDELGVVGLDSRFVVLYSGLFGIKHGLETVVDAAALLVDLPEVSFVFLGAGPRSDFLKQRVAELGLENVVFLGNRRMEEVAALLSSADVCVTSLRPDDYLKKTIPAKIFEYMACAKPIVAAIAGEGARVVHDAQAGIVTPPGNAVEMAQAVRTLYSNPAMRELCGENGRRFVEAYYSREKTADYLVRAMEELCPARVPAHFIDRLAA